MLTSFFKTTIRTLLKNKTYSFLNIFGLAVGIACAGLIFLWAEDELAYDGVNVKKDRLYMVMNNWPFVQHFVTYGSTPGPLAAAMKAEMPGVANACRYSDREDNVLFRIGERSMYAGGSYADSAVFSMLTLPFVQGNAKDAFKQLHSLVITEKTAKKFFGDEKNVIGKTVRANNKEDYTITGVIKDFPENTTLQFEWVAPFDIFLKQHQGLLHWDDNSQITLAELKSNANPDAVNRQLHGFIQSKFPASTATSMLFSMNDWRLRWQFENGKQTGGGRIQYVRMFITIAWIILLLACINFMNLATARSEKRAKEVGVRKVLGSGRRKLVVQFMGEAMVMSLLSVTAAVFIILLVLPLFNLLVQKQLALNLLQPAHLAALGAVTLVCGLVSGSYPSLYLSSFNPLQVFKSLKLKSGSAGFIRRGLVVLQFTASVVLIISTVIVYQQVRHLKNRPVGFNRDNVMVVPVHEGGGKNFNAIKQGLFSTGMVENAALADHETIYGGQNDDGYTWKGKDPNADILISHRSVSSELFNTTGIKIIQGRGFGASATADSSNIIITETLARMMHTPNVLGQLIRDGNNNTWHIIGVARDFVYGDMKVVKSDPLIFFSLQHNQDASLLYIKLKPNSNTQQAVAKTGGVVKKYNPAYPFTYKFMDDEFNELFLTEMLVGRLSGIFAALAILISCLGLFGLAAYTAERRTKEIGIRKVLGANAAGLAGLLSREFINLVILSSLLAFPLAWYGMNTWLQTYETHINISPWVFVAAGAGAMVIAVVTISFQAVKAAMMNPVKSLKTE